MSQRPPIVVLDSGLGGLTVLQAISRALPGQRVVYVADDAGFPYGDWGAEALRARVIELFAELLARYQPAIIVLACNTAATLALAGLRRAYPQIMFVGTVPAIKPAAERTRSGVLALLATPVTVDRDYTRDLVNRFAGECHVERVGSRRLARLAEAHMQGCAVSDADVLDEISPCFVARSGQRTDIVILACTHYPLLGETLRRVAPWPVEWVDPANAIARRVQALSVNRAGQDRFGDRVDQDLAVFTHGIPADSTRRLMANYGLTCRSF